MRKQRKIALITTGLVATAVTLTAQNPPQTDPPPRDQPIQDKQTQPRHDLTPAGEPYDATKDQTFRDRDTAETTKHCSKASSLIGKDVRNAQNEKLGDVKDLIVSLGDGTVPFAIITYGGALGLGEKAVVVPLSELQYSSDGRSLFMPVSKESFHAGCKAASGGWVTIAQQDWAKGINAFYGEPRGRFEREPLGWPEGRQPVRDPAARPSPGPEDTRPSAKKGAEQLINKTTPAAADADLRLRVTSVLDQHTGGGESTVMCHTENGVVTLTGEVESETRKLEIESAVKAISGVQRVDNRLTVR